MVSRTSITLYSGLTWFLVAFVLTCHSVKEFGKAVAHIHDLKEDFDFASLSIRGGLVKHEIFYDSYDVLVGRFSAVLAFLILLMLSIVAWVMTALVYVIKFDGDTRKARLFSILFAAILTAVCVCGVVSFALISAAVGGVYVEEVAMIAFWALSVVFGVATCVILCIDTRKAAVVGFDNSNNNNMMTQAGKTMV